MQTPSMTRIRLLMVNAAAAGLLFVACAAPSVAQEPRNPKPKFNVVDSTRPSNEELKTYLASLQFRTDHVASDTRMVSPTQIVRVDPAVDNYLSEDSKLREKGMILSRIVNLGTDSISRFGLTPKGTTYLWVQNAGGALRGVLISTDSSGNIAARFPVR